MNYASIVVLSLERPKVLRWSLKSLQDHTHYPHELIVHDDGSTDPDVMEFLLEQLSSGGISSLVLNPPGRNMAVGFALNRSLPMCLGKYIVVMDGDYQYLDGWLGEAVELLEAFPEASIVSLARSYSDKYNRRTFIKFRTQQGVTVEQRWTPGTSSIVFRRGDLVWPVGSLKLPTAEPWSLIKSLCPGVWHSGTPQPEGFQGPWCISPISPKVFHPPVSVLQGIFGIYDATGKRYRRPAHRYPLLHGEVSIPEEEALWSVDEAPLRELGVGLGNRYLLGRPSSTGFLLEVPPKYEAPLNWKRQ